LGGRLVWRRWPSPSDLFIGASPSAKRTKANDTFQNSPENPGCNYNLLYAKILSLIPGLGNNQRPQGCSVSSDGYTLFGCKLQKSAIYDRGVIKLAYYIGFYCLHKSIGITQTGNLCHPP
jgi:hypothetical protein